MTDSFLFGVFPYIAFSLAIFGGVYGYFAERLVHIFTIPITYLWRPFQVVIWNQRRREAEE
jgi:nitrate reductase gamma subunit